MELFVEFLQKNLVWAKMTKKWSKIAQEWDFLTIFKNFVINLHVQTQYLGKFFFWSYSW